jgi:two-component system, OmpR family, sensor histidine kinase VicK
MHDGPNLMKNLPTHHYPGRLLPAPINLLSTNELAAQIITDLPQAILITTALGGIIYVNPAWEKLTGYNLKEVKYKNPRFLKSGKTPKSLYKKMWDSLSKNQSITNEELINKTKEGIEFIAHSTIFPLTGQNKALYYIQILYDITKRKEEESQREQLLSIVSHELKTPITVMKLLCSQSLHNIKHKPVTANDIQTISYELDRLTELINESLDISRIDSNRLNFDLQIFDLSSLIKDVVQQTKIISQNHLLKVNIRSSLEVIADIKRIKQVLLNFITNAIKYSPPNTIITITGIKRSKEIIVAVSDNGIGIQKNKLNKIFERSFQIKSKSTEGLGLGLYIASEIIKKHRGKIWVESKYKVGSTFYFSLPIVKFD